MRYAERYVIKKEGVGYFTEMVVARTVPIHAPMDIVLHEGSPPVKKGQQIGTDTFYRPEFGAFKSAQAIQFDTAADAEGQINNVSETQMDDPQAFDGCTVEES